MAKSQISREAREYIIETVRENGIVTVEGVSEKVRPLYLFDPVKAETREVANLSRRILRSMRDAGGDRSLLAVKGFPGTYSDIDHCKSPGIIQAVVEQLTEKHVGIARTLNKAKRKQTEIEGQLSMFEQPSEAKQ